VAIAAPFSQKPSILETGISVDVRWTATCDDSYIETRAASKRPAKRSNEMTSMMIEQQRNQGLRVIAPACFGTDLQDALDRVGERYGIYEAMTQTGPVTPQELAGFTGLSRQYVETWLQAQALTGALHISRPANRYCLWCRWTPQQSR
jgi:hypothetical protein